LLGNGESSVLLLLGVNCVVRCQGFGSGAVCVLGSWDAFVLDSEALVCKWCFVRLYTPASLFGMFWVFVFGGVPYICGASCIRF